MDKTNVVKNNNYTAMPTEFLQDSRLSLTAKGLMSEMAYEEKTDFTLEELLKYGSLEEIILSVTELSRFGYLTRLNVG